MDCLITAGVIWFVKDRIIGFPIIYVLQEAQFRKMVNIGT